MEGLQPPPPKKYIFGLVAPLHSDFSLPFDFIQIDVYDWLCLFYTFI